MSMSDPEPSEELLMLVEREIRGPETCEQIIALGPRGGEPVRRNARGCLGALGGGERDLESRRRVVEDHGGADDLDVPDWARTL